MRMGIGVTGYAMATEEQRGWLDATYQCLRVIDREYSALHGWPTSIKLTTVKPSGTLSLLAGVTSGGHPAYAEYYIRRIRIASDSPLVEVCRASGFKVEYVRNFDGTDDHRTVVVEFPCKTPEHAIFARDITAIDQLEMIKRLQTEWSDNAVSVTIYYKLEELPAIKEWLALNFTDCVKSVSFLLHSEHGFDQAPLEEITQEQYLELSSRVTPITSVSFNEDDISEDQMACPMGGCPLK
jgi:ribonucleoside-diphosphate reductase alpha chain/ribonucleoside-triphosphate reductase